MTDHDILIQIREDVKHVRESLSELRKSDEAQWHKLDDHAQKISSLHGSNKGLWITISSLLGGGGLLGVALWLMNR